MRSQFHQQEGYRQGVSSRPGLSKEQRCWTVGDNCMSHVFMEYDELEYYLGREWLTKQRLSVRKGLVDPS